MDGSAKYPRTTRPNSNYDKPLTLESSRFITIESDCDTDKENLQLTYGLEGYNYQDDGLDQLPELIKATAQRQIVDNDDKNIRLPWIILILSCVQIVVFILAKKNEWINNLLLFDPHNKTELWRLASYMLLHSDKIHLFLNICLEYFAGSFLEAEQGRWRVLLLLLTGGIAGCLGSSIFQPQLAIVGASAGVYSLLMSHVPHLVMNFFTLPFKYLRVTCLLILCLSDVGFTTFHCIQNNNTHPKIGLAAHIAGALSGLVLGFVVYRKRDQTKFQRLIYTVVKCILFLSYLICLFYAIYLIYL